MKNKYLIGLGAISTIALPIAVISCSCSSKNKMEAKETDEEDVNEVDGENTNTNTDTDTDTDTKVVEEKQARRYISDKVTYTFNDRVATFTLSGRDTAKIDEIFDGLEGNKFLKVRDIVFSGDRSDEAENFALWLYHPFNRDSFDVANNVNTPNSLEFKHNDQNRVQLIIRFGTGVVQPTEEQSLRNTRRYVDDNSIRDKLIEVDPDIRETVLEIWSIIANAIKTEGTDSPEVTENPIYSQVIHSSRNLQIVGNRAFFDIQDSENKERDILESRDSSSISRSFFTYVDKYYEKEAQVISKWMKDYGLGFDDIKIGFRVYVNGEAKFIGYKTRVNRHFDKTNFLQTLRYIDGIEIENKNNPNFVHTDNIGEFNKW